MNPLWWEDWGLPASLNTENVSSTIVEKYREGKSRFDIVLDFPCWIFYAEDTV